MTSWLEIFGWFLVVLGILPVLLLTGIGIGSFVYGIWLRREVKRFERVKRLEREAIATEIRRQAQTDSALQALILMVELEEFLGSQP